MPDLVRDLNQSIEMLSVLLGKIGLIHLTPGNIRYSNDGFEWSGSSKKSFDELYRLLEKVANRPVQGPEHYPVIRPESTELEQTAHSLLSLWQDHPKAEEVGWILTRIIQCASLAVYHGKKIGLKYPPGALHRQWQHSCPHLREAA